MFRMMDIELTRIYRILEQNLFSVCLCYRPVDWRDSIQHTLWYSILGSYGKIYRIICKIISHSP